MPASTVQEDNFEILDQIIPKDPNFPSIAYQAHEHVPICVPWVHNVIALGTGFESSVAANPKTDEVAFRPRALAAGKAQYQLEPTDNTNSFRQNSSTHSATSYEHMDMKGSLSVGGSMLGLSGRAAFSKNVFENKDSNKVSLQASLRIGRITSITSPRLSDYALSLLHDSPTEFHRVYGDYFLGALYLGADTSTFLSSSSSVDLKAEMKEIQVQAKFLGMKKTLVDKRTSSQSSASDYNITFDGFDTLDGTVQNAKAKDMQSYMMIKEQAAKNVAGGITLDKRVKEVLRSLLGAEVGTMVPLTKEQCDAVCKSGLVVELMFLPYAGLRDYVAATLNTSSQLY